MKIGLVGWGVETQSAYRFFGSSHEYVIMNEHYREDFPPPSPNITVQSLAATRQKGDVGKETDLSYMHDIESCELIVIQPTARKNVEKFVNNNPEVLARLKTAQDVFFENSPTKNVVGITGTKGKSTVTQLVYSMLKEAGKHVFMGGNIGICPLDFVHELTDESWVILELSSYQLDSTNHSPHIAVHLMMEPEHLNWHGTMENYVHAKSNLIRHQSTNDITIYDPQNDYSVSNAELSPGLKIPFSKPPGAYIESDWFCISGKQLVKLDEVKIIGSHNHHNICAAITTAWQIDTSIEPIRRALQNFHGLPHHMEYIHVHGATTFINDSVATVPAASMAAVSSLQGSIYLLMGGEDRGLPIDEYVEFLTRESKIKAILVFGDIRNRLMSAFENSPRKDAVHASEGETMEAVIQSMPDDISGYDYVLLAPGFPSYDMYLKYTYRGEAFERAVKERYP